MLLRHIIMSRYCVTLLRHVIASCYCVTLVSRYCVTLLCPDFIGCMGLITCITKHQYLFLRNIFYSLIASCIGSRILEASSITMIDTYRPSVGAEVPWFSSCRMSVAVIGFFAFFNAYSQRVGMSVAIICMVNQTAVRELRTERYGLLYFVSW